MRAESQTLMALSRQRESCSAHRVARLVLKIDAKGVKTVTESSDHLCSNNGFILCTLNVFRKFYGKPSNKLVKQTKKKKGASHPSHVGSRGKVDASSRDHELMNFLFRPK